jgi:hypothetical protein
MKPGKPLPRSVSYGGGTIPAQSADGESFDLPLNAQASLEQDGVESEIKAMFSSARFANDAQSRVSSNLALEDGETIELLRNDASFLLISRHADGRTKNVTSWGLAAVGGTMPSDTKQTLMASRIRRFTTPMALSRRS